MDDPISRLEAEYCPPIDTSVLLAILSDYDLTDQKSVAEARVTLNAIKADAEVEQAATDFDDSGLNGTGLNGEHAKSSSRDRSEETDITSLSNGMSDLSTSSTAVLPNDFTEDEQSMQALDAATKSLVLQGLFPAVGAHKIEHVLKKCDSSWHRALDELLNISFFSDPDSQHGDIIPNRGIEAFSEDQIAKRGRKKKRKGANQRVLLDERRTSSLPSSPVSIVNGNPWKSTSGDVDFLVRHTKLSTATILSAYSANNASVPRTITHLLDDMVGSASKVTSSNTTIKENALELGRDFPTISAAYLTALIQLTHPSSASAHALADALVAKPLIKSSGPIIPQYKGLSLSDDESFTPTSSPHPLAGSSRLNALSQRDAHRLLSSQAAAAYRKSRSNHLYGGAAAYYASEARDAANSAAAATSAAADVQVAAQSSPDQLDLHGTVVADAVRIAKRETAAWWAGLGEARLNGRKGATERDIGFRNVVGLGRHSEGGKSRIGPAVHKALVAEGWRVEQGSGTLTVRGKARA
ncbi:hypothetical protein BDZ85DRAFT_295945 [Elsinoe ampelina]|uniref:UBA-like domain-containing protein n=1 Tax=Elsinoe ampelina TaxID=302913 RepID=A0A6A6GDI4_9PEZI|nr:hypothetical protein BDZ85DRAFT_295945 [Elsinoe ampelina]